MMKPCLNRVLSRKQADGGAIETRDQQLVDGALKRIFIMKDGNSLA
jgi:hypothetical protein